MEFVRLQQLYRPGQKALCQGEVTDKAKEFQLFRKRIEGDSPDNEQIVGLVYNPVGKKAQMALAHGTKVSFYNVAKLTNRITPPGEAVYSVNKFKDLATCLSVRQDGRLLVGGEAGGSLAVMEWEEGRYY